MSSQNTPSFTTLRDYSEIDSTMNQSSGDSINDFSSCSGYSQAEGGTISPRLNNRGLLSEKQVNHVLSCDSNTHKVEDKSGLDETLPKGDNWRNAEEEQGSNAGRYYVFDWARNRGTTDNELMNRIDHGLAALGFHSPQDILDRINKTKYVESDSFDSDLSEAASTLSDEFSSESLNISKTPSSDEGRVWQNERKCVNRPEMNVQIEIEAERTDKNKTKRLRTRRERDARTGRYFWHEGGSGSSSDSDEELNELFGCKKVKRF